MLLSNMDQLLPDLVLDAVFCHVFRNQFCDWYPMDWLVCVMAVQYCRLPQFARTILRQCRPRFLEYKIQRQGEEQLPSLALLCVWLGVIPDPKLELRRRRILASAPVTQGMVFGASRGGVPMLDRVWQLHCDVLGLPANKFPTSATAVDSRRDVATLGWWWTKHKEHGLKFIYADALYYAMIAFKGARDASMRLAACHWWRDRARHHVDELSLPPTYMLLVHASTYNHVDTLNWIWQASVADPASVGPQTIHISRATRHTVLPWWLDLHDTHDHRIAFPSFTWQLDVNDPCEDVQAFWDLQSRPCARAGASDKCAIRIQLSRHFHGSPDLRLFDWLQQHGQIGTDTRSIHDGLVKTFKSAWQRRRFDALDAIMARGFGQFRNLTFMVTLSNCLQTAAANNDTELLRPRSNAPAMLALLATESLDHGGGNLALPVESLKYLVGAREEYGAQQLLDWLATHGPAHGVDIAAVEDDVELKAQWHHLQLVARLSILQ
ncbi:hypothetical protein BC828DRAFT_415252 [Blastocladiella britannica]|nr:hypothetical protein BC828DRAFT_415252 [Blastocladiella britannica]